MNWNTAFPRRVFGRLASAAALTAAMCAPAAHAGVLNFETPVDSPFVFNGSVLTLGKYYVEGAGDINNTGTEPSFVGAIGGSDSCSSGVQCPANNATNYYTAVDDGYLYFGMADGSAFSLKSLDASFVGAGLASYPAVAGVLFLQAYDADGIVDSRYLNLNGPFGGSFNFSTYDLSGFGGGKMFTDVLVASFACNTTSTNCDRLSNQANFALDNIVTVEAAAVPEPGSFALLGLGLLGLRAARRRTTAAA